MANLYTKKVVKKYLKKILTFLLLLVIEPLFPQEIGFGLAPFSTNWQVSRVFNLSEKTNAYTSFISFQYPMELKLAPEYNDPQKTQHEIFQPIHFASITASSAILSTLALKIEGLSIFLTKTNDLEQGSKFPLNQQIYNYYIPQKPTMVFLYKRKNFLLNLDLQMNLIGTNIGITSPESLNSRLVLSYRIGGNLANYFENTYLNIGLQYSEISRYDHRYLSSLKKIEMKDYSLIPGFALTGKNVTVEGMIQMPMQHIYGLNFKNFDSIRDEVQGRLGLRWQLPSN